jgi:hypothetical protein
MRQLLVKIKNWISNYFLVRKMKKEIQENIDYYFAPIGPTSVEVEVDKKYQNGMTLLKSKIKEKVDEGYSFQEAITLVGEDLLTLANLEDDKKIELIRSVYVYGTVDIKAEADKIKMIDRRIADYKRLQDNKLKRELSREIRKAMMREDYHLYDRLSKEWRQKYG